MTEPPIALPYLAAARASGADAAAFLHAQLSADVLGLEPNGARFACYCSPRGQVLGLLQVVRVGDDFMLVASSALLPGLLDRLSRFVLRSRVSLEALEGWSCFGLPEAASDFGGCLIAPIGFDLRYGVAPGPARADEAAALWKAEELRRGVAWLDERTRERFIPQMLGFEALGAVSFSKGCYPGQEIVARARYLGQVKRRPLQIRLECSEPLAAGAAARIRSGEAELEVTVIDSAAGADGRTVAELVGPEAKGPVEAIEIEGRRYRCATM